MRDMLRNLAIAIFALGVAAPALGQGADTDLGSQVAQRALANPAAPLGSDLIVTYRGVTGAATIGLVSSLPASSSSLVVGTTAISGVCTSGFNIFNNAGVLGCQSGASSIVIGTTPITGGATTQVLFNLAGVVSSDSGFTYAGSGGQIKGAVFATPNAAGVTTSGSFCYNSANCPNYSMFLNDVNTLVFNINSSSASMAIRGAALAVETFQVTRALTIGAAFNAPDVWIGRTAAGGVLTSGTAFGNALGSFNGASLILSGSPPTLTGTCAAGTQTGGNAAGTLTTTGSCAGTTIIMTFAVTAPTGWACDMQDQTALPSTLPRQTASSTGSATMTVTTAGAEVMRFKCLAY